MPPPTWSPPGTPLEKKLNAGSATAVTDTNQSESVLEASAYQARSKGRPYKWEGFFMGRRWELFSARILFTSWCTQLPSTTPGMKAEGKDERRHRSRRCFLTGNEGAGRMPWKSSAETFLSTSRARKRQWSPVLGHVKEGVWGGGGIRACCKSLEFASGEQSEASRDGDELLLWLDLPRLDHLVRPCHLLRTGKMRVFTICLSLFFRLHNNKVNAKTT